MKDLHVPDKNVVEYKKHLRVLLEDPIFQVLLHDSWPVYLSRIFVVWSLECIACFFFERSLLDRMTLLLGICSKENAGLVLVFKV